MEKKGINQLLIYLLGFIVMIAIIMVLMKLKSIFVPFTVALFVAILGRPVIRFFTKRCHLPNSLSAIIFIILIALVVALFVILVFYLVNDIYDKVGTYKDNYVALYSKYSETFRSIFRRFDSETFQLSKFIDSLVPEDPNIENIFIDPLSENDEDLLAQQELTDIFSLFSINSILAPAFRITNYLVNFFRQFLMMVIFLFFILLEWPHLAKKLIYMFPNKNMVSLFGNVNSEISEYLYIKTIISLITAVGVMIVCIIARQDFLIMWGVLAFVFNFIPSIGSIIFTVFITFMAAVQFLPLQQWWNVAIVATGITGVQFIIGNIIDPKISGDRLDLSPSLILVFLLICGFIWGVVGMFLSIPIMLFIKAVCDQVPSLVNIGILFSSGKKLPSKIYNVTPLSQKEESISKKGRVKNLFRKGFASLKSALSFKQKNATPTNESVSDSSKGDATNNE